VIPRCGGAGEPGDQADLHDAQAAGHGDGAADDAGQRADRDQRRDAGPLPDRVQRRAEGQDDQELGQGRAAGKAIMLACLAARNRRQPGEDTSGEG
jgi:hypothetical protein